MRIHHLNGGTLDALGVRALPRMFRAGAHDHLVCHCLLIEHPRGLVLVDTAFGKEDLVDPAVRFGRGFLFLSGPRLLDRERLARQIEALGREPEEVRHIVLTHLDLDHAGGLADFPQARVHVHGTELRAARDRKTRMERGRYLPAQWEHEPDWVLHDEPGAGWMGIEGAQTIDELDGDLLLIPLPGHTHGHCGVAVRNETGWLLHAGDSYMNQLEIDPVHPKISIGSGFFQNLIQMDRRARLRSREHLRRLRREHADEVEIFCAHEPDGFARFTP